MAAKIFRINYKSDFILTLNSDAGWMTPFCIKFWTGAPSQAFFVVWDGTTYTHCSYDPSEPTKLVVQFDDHHLPIGDLKLQIAYHFTVADFPNDTEDEVTNPANITTEIDGQVYQVMLDFTGETAPEIEFSLPAYANEAQRIANEQQRIAAEETRIDNEAQRIQNEETRINQEQTRQDNEAQRIRNEQTRISQEEARVREFATLKHDSQEATAAANDAAALANQKAQLAADKAALAHDAAALANEKAQLAAAKAALANDAAALANEKAALAQQKAEYAQTQGGYAKDQGDYAKEQGDYAKRKGDDAAAQMQQQAQAFSEAQADRQTAYEQAEGTESGSEAGDGSRWGAFKTNEAARDAKVDAKVADITNLQKAVAEGAVYDISANHLTEGVPTKYANLSAALGADGANIPANLRKGGMSIKYIQSSDNKYVQARCMAQNFTTDVTQWQVVDDVPTAGSENLVKSGGVYEEVSQLGKKLKIEDNRYDFCISDDNGNSIVVFQGGGIRTKNFNSQNTGLLSEKVYADLDIIDTQENVLVRFKNGHIRTKNFNSEKLYDPTQKFRNKKIAFLGDSITTFRGYLPSDISGYTGQSYASWYPAGDVNSVSKTWWWKLAIMMGLNPLTDVANCSWSGSTVTGNSESEDNAYPGCSNRRISDLSIKGFDPDIIICFISCNDWGNQARAIGSWSINDPVPDEGEIITLRQAYALMLYKIHSVYPNARVFCCTNMDDRLRDTDTDYPPKNINGVSVYDWNTNIIQIAEALGCDIINTHDCGINYANMLNFVVDTGLHPNALGMDMLARKVFAELISKY